MQRRKTSFHIEWQRSLLLVVAFVFLLLLIESCTVLLINPDCVQFNSLCSSDYSYSATISEPGFQDDFYIFDAEITFVETPEENKAICADVLMQTKQSLYTDSINWNAEKLSENGIAVSKNIAKTYHLQIGDELYSKHIVNGSLKEYVVEDIVSEVESARVSKETGLKNGIVIMGFDNQYIDNLRHYGITFSTETLDDLFSQYSEMPTNLIYREDELQIVLLRIIPYLLLLCLGSILVAFLQVFSLARIIKHNFRRLLFLGANKRSISKAYFRLVSLLCLTPSLCAAAFSFLSIFCIVDMNATKATVLLLGTLINCGMLMLFSCIWYHRLWRNE